MNFHLLSHMILVVILRTSLITPVSVITVVGIDILIEQDEHCKFVGSLLTITQRSYHLSTSARVGDAVMLGIANSRTG